MNWTLEQLFAGRRIADGDYSRNVKPIRGRSNSCDASGGHLPAIAGDVQFQYQLGVRSCGMLERRGNLCADLACNFLTNQPGRNVRLLDRLRLAHLAANVHTNTNQSLILSAKLVAFR